MRFAPIFAAAVLGAGLIAGGAAQAQSPVFCAPGLARLGLCPGYDDRTLRALERQDEIAARRAYDRQYRDARRDALRRGERWRDDRGIHRWRRGHTVEQQPVYSSER